LLCENVDEADKLVKEAFKLREERSDAQAKEKFFELFNLYRDTKPGYAAEMLFMAATCANPKEAIKYYEMVAKLSYSRRDFQFAITALEKAIKCCNWLGDLAKIAELKIEIKKITQDVPHNLEECFAELRRQLDPKQLEAFENLKEEELIKCHLGLGMWIRNCWGLWHHSELAKYLANKGFRHPDSMSGEILLKFHRHLRKQTKQRKSYPKKGEKKD
jgi:tetratricopeptide (TPR) repeat protein